MHRGNRLAILMLFAAAEAHAAADRGFTLSVLVGDRARCEYPARGALYVEALRGVPYALRLTNPLSRRVAVALAVDGLNTIDAGHGPAWDAKKWVIEPYGSVTIPGWQVTGESARAFFFTGEKGSYGAALGRTENLGVIEAVFFAERVPLAAAEPPSAPLRVGAGAPREAAPGASAKTDALSDDFAGTGMGGRRDHPVVEVAMDLDPDPAARIRLRYEFRPQLAALGIVPTTAVPPRRREQAEGFAEFCPEPAR